MAKNETIKKETSISVPDLGPIIEAWFQEWFHNQPGFSDVQLIHSRLHDAKKDLKKRLIKEV